MVNTYRVVFREDLQVDALAATPSEAVSEALGYVNGIVEKARKQQEENTDQDAEEEERESVELRDWKPSDIISVTVISKPVNKDSWIRKD